MFDKTSIRFLNSISGKFWISILIGRKVQLKPNECCESLWWNWMPRDIERRFLTFKLILKRYQRKRFWHHLVTGVKKWICYGNHKKHKYYAKLGKPIPSSATSRSKKSLLGSKMYHELLNPGETIAAKRYRPQASNVRKSWLDDFAIWQSSAERGCDGQKLHGNAEIRGYTPSAVFSRLCSLLEFLMDAKRFDRTPVRFFYRNREIAQWFDQDQRELIF